MEFYLVFSVFYVHLVHIFPPNFSVRRHGIQEVGGLFFPIAKSLISNEIRLFYFVSLNMFFQAGEDGGFLRFTPLV